MWPTLAASVVSGFYGWLAARSTTDDALVLVQVSFVCSLAFVAAISTPKQKCRIVALCVVIALCFFGTFVVLVGGRRGIAPNKWDIFDEDDVTIFTTSYGVSNALDRVDATATALTANEWRNSSLVVQAATTRTPWYLFTSVALSKKELISAENHMHIHRKIDVLDFASPPFTTYAVRQNAKSTLAGYEADCNAKLLRCLTVAP